MITTLISSDHHQGDQDAILAALPPPAAMPLPAVSTALRENRNHGSLQPLTAHLARHGLLNPVTLNPAGQVIIGERRALAAAAAGMSVIDCRTVTTIQQALNVIIAERLCDQADPEAAATAELPDILALAEMDAAIRTLEWWPRSSGEGKGDKHRIALTEAADNPDGSMFWNTAHYTHARSIWLAAQGLRSNSGTGRPLTIPAKDRQAATQALSELRHRDTTRLTAIHSRWRSGLPPARRKPPGDARTFSSKDVPALLASLRGYNAAVIHAGVPAGDLTADDRARLDTTLSELLAHLRQLRKGIRQ